MTQRAWRRSASPPQVSKGAFYHHFPSKQSVFLELLKDWLQGLDIELGKAMGQARNVPDGLLAMAAETKGVFNAADGRIQLFFEFWQQARRDPEVWKEFIAPYRRYQDYFASIIEQGIAEGSVQPDRPAGRGPGARRTGPGNRDPGRC